MTKSGRVLDVSITVSPIRDSQGNIIGASKIARDITERVESERRRDEFISTASHELKTPITSQKVYGELLEQQIMKHDDLEYLPYIQKMNIQTQKLEKLITDLLELSRIQVGRLKLELQRFSIDELVNETLEDLGKTTNHKLIYKGGSGQEIEADRERIGQVLINLLSNAIKYSPHANKIIITSQSEADRVQISVKDFGIGIDPIYHEKVFERFFRVADDEEKTYPGMGIGLDFSRQVLDRHNGKIWVDSAKGKGATFYVSLPLNQQETDGDRASIATP
jgi:signal transduction histidine kinase